MGMSWYVYVYIYVYMYISGYDTYNWIFFEAFTLSDGWQLFSRFVWVSNPGCNTNDLQEEDDRKKPIVPPERRSNRDGSLMIFVFPQRVFGQQEFITLHCDVCWRVKKGDLAPLLELKAAQCSAQKFNAPDTGQF